MDFFVLFSEADIDLELLKGLEDKDYLSFFPTVGSKIRFRCKLEEWKNKNAAQEAASSKVKLCFLTAQL